MNVTSCESQPNKSDHCSSLSVKCTAQLSIRSKLFYRVQFALRVALLIILPACLFSTNYGREAGSELTRRIFRAFPEVFSYYAVVASAAFLTIREKGCLESTRFFLIVLQGWLLVACSTLLYTTIIGLAPYEFAFANEIKAMSVHAVDVVPPVSIHQIRTCTASLVHFFNSVHFWLVYYSAFSFLLGYLVRDERNLRLSLVVFTITMMGVYKENERMNCLATPGCTFDRHQADGYFSILSMRATASHHENKLRALLVFVLSILSEFLCGIFLGALATFIPYPLVHPSTSLGTSMRTIKETFLHPLTLCIFDYLPKWKYGPSPAPEGCSALSPRIQSNRPSRRPEWLRAADALKASLSLTASIMIYVGIYGNNGWSIPGPAILCFVAVFCDSHIEKFEKKLQRSPLDFADRASLVDDSGSFTKHWWHSPKALRLLQTDVFSALIYGGIHRLMGTFAAALLGFITFLLASDSLWYLFSLVCTIFLFAFLRSYHVELFGNAGATHHAPKSKLCKAYVCLEEKLMSIGTAVGVASFYGCFFLVGIINPSIEPHEILTRIVKNVIAVVVYWLVSLVYTLIFVWVD